MKWFVFLLIPVLLSCDQHPKQAKTTKDTTIANTDTTTEEEEEEEVSDAEMGQYEIDSLFAKMKDSAAYNFEDDYASVKIGNLFSKENKDAVFRMYPDDSTEQVIVLRQSGAKWDTLLSEMITTSRSGPYPLDIVTVEDFNGDHIPDLKVIKDTWDFHIGERSNLWLYRDNHFIKVKNFDEIVSAESYDSTGLILSYQSAGCADMAMNFGTYRIVADTVQEIDFRYCGCCDPSDSCEIKIQGKKEFKVPYKSAWKYVPEAYQDKVKDKLEM